MDAKQTEDYPRFPARDGLTLRGTGLATLGLLICLLYGALFGAMLGATVGGAVGLCFFIIGIFWGIPIGGIVGAIVGASCGFWGALFGGRWGWTAGSGLGMTLAVLASFRGAFSNGPDANTVALLLAPAVIAATIGYFLSGSILERAKQTNDFYGNWRMSLKKSGYFSTTFLERFVAGMLLLSCFGLLGIVCLHLR